VVEVSKNFKGDLKGELWEAATTLLAANQALCLRVQRAEGDTKRIPKNFPSKRGNNKFVFRYEVSRLRQENERLGEEIRLLKDRMEWMCKTPPPFPKEKESKEREKRRVT
jgi:hypothetical protein